MSRIVVLGGAESGVGSAVLAKVKGFDVFLSDNGKIKDSYAQILRDWDTLNTPLAIERAKRLEPRRSRN